MPLSRKNTQRKIERTQKEFEREELKVIEENSSVSHGDRTRVHCVRVIGETGDRRLNIDDPLR